MVDMDTLTRKATERGYTLASLERAANLANGLIKSWEKGSPTLFNLEKVAKILNCSIDELVKKEEV